MYVVLFLVGLTAVAKLTGSFLTRWPLIGCAVACSVWLMLYHKSIWDYADLIAQRFRVEVLLSSIRAKGFEALTDDYYRDCVRSNWLILGSFIRRVTVYHMAEQHWFLRQWIARPPSELATSVIDMETQLISPKWPLELEQDDKRSIEMQISQDL